MLVIDRTLSAHTLYVTASESGVQVTSGVTITVSELATNKITTFSLSNDMSTFPERFNKYILTGTTGLAYGQYYYIMKASDDTILEEGILECNDGLTTPQEQLDFSYYYLSGNSQDDEYLVNTN